MSTHECPAPGCTEQVDGHRLACVRHWYAIPRDLRGELWRAYREEGQMSDGHVAAMEKCLEPPESFEVLRQQAD